LPSKSRKLTRERVALLEYARPFGQIALMLDMHPRSTQIDAPSASMKNCSPASLKSIAPESTSSDAPPHPAGREEQRAFVTLEAFLKILAFVQCAFDFVVVDLGFVNTAEWSRALAMADAFRLVAEPRTVALGMPELYLLAAESAGLDASRFQIVLNRGRQNDTDFAARRVAALRQTLLARLPSDYRQVSEAVTFGAPLAAGSSNALLSRYRKLAVDLLGIETLDTNRNATSPTATTIT
jgi:hypothetical protein